jgi:hypothetical protein
MTYSKPQIIAQNGGQGIFAAGCPAKMNGQGGICKSCERSS